ncbi:MAG: hypothetical protein STHCBS139747_005727 [Sporothrix thermara]
MDGGQCAADLLPNYYAILNVEVYASIRDVPKAFYRIVQEAASHGRSSSSDEHDDDKYRLVHDAYDCLSSTVDRAAYNEFYFNTPCWYSRRLWIAYRNERRRLEERQLRRDREARERAALDLCKAAAASPPVSPPVSPPGAIFCRGNPVIKPVVDAAVNAVVDAVQPHTTVDAAVETASTTCATDDTLGVDNEALDVVSKGKVLADIAAAELETEHQPAIVHEEAPAPEKDKPAKTKRKRKTRRGGAQRQRKVKATDKKAAQVFAKSSPEKELFHHQTTHNDRQGAETIIDNSASVVTTPKPVKMIAHSRWADPNKCSDGLAGHPYENWQVKPGFDKCMVCNVWYYGSTFRCVKCDTLFCKHCYAETTTLRRNSHTEIVA